MAKGRSEKCKVSYIAESIILFVICYIWYYCTYYTQYSRICPGSSLTTLNLTAVPAFAVSLLMYYFRFRSTLTVIVSSVSPFCLYTFTFMRGAYRNYGEALLYTLGTVLLLSLMIIYQLTKPKSKRQRSMNRKGAAKRCAFAAHIVFTLLIGFSVINTVLRNVIYTEKDKTDTSPAIVSSETDTKKDENFLLSVYTYYAYEDELVKFRTETWDTLSRDEKVRLLRILANVEANALGLSHRIPLTAGDLERRSTFTGTVGEYIPGQDERIVIDNQYIDEENPYYLISTVCHEVMHAYQHSLTELYKNTSEEYRSLKIFESVPEYLKESADYEKTLKNYDDYYDLTTEKEARKHGKERADYYYNMIYGIDITLDPAFRMTAPAKRMSVFK